MKVRLKNLQEATEKICDLKGSILALDTLLSAFTYALPLEARAELMQRLQMHAEVARTALLLAEISEHTITAFERDVHRSMKMVEASLRPRPVTEDTPTPSTQETPMPKGQQRTNKESRKPKKDSSPPKPISTGIVTPTRTTVVPDRSKKK